MRQPRRGLHLPSKREDEEHGPGLHGLHFPLAATCFILENVKNLNASPSRASGAGQPADPQAGLRATQRRQRCWAAC